MASVSLQHLKKIYDGGVLAVEDFNIDIKDGEFVVIVGPSGCGKSTTLRMIAGLEGISDGHAFVDDKEITNLSPKDRDMAMVFQNYALYAHMTIYQNMAFSLMLRKEKKEIIHEKVMHAANILGLLDQLNKKPKELSGGQRQRVAVGRAIVRDPKVFLFDEPLSNLDAKLRGVMRRELKLLHYKLGATMIYVTHDQVEALTLADRIVIMSMGKVQQIATPYELYNNPANIFVASFIGNPPMNFVGGKVDEKGTFVCEEFSFKLDKTNFDLIKKNEMINKAIVLGIRPENVEEGDKVTFNIDLVEHIGQATLVHTKINDLNMVFKLPGWLEYKDSETLGINFKQDKICFFDAETEERIK